MAMFEVDEDWLARLSVEQLREEVRNYAGRWIELQFAMRDLPELPSPELLHVLGDWADMSDHVRGKALQRDRSVEEIPPVSECEGGAGVWSIIRAALVASRAETPTP